jgi:hypothetical protein
MVMHHRKRLAAGVIVLGFAVIALAGIGRTVAADDEEIVVPKKTLETVNKMADDIAKGNKVDKTADMFFKDNGKEPLKKTMWIFKERDKGGKGGLGIGAKPGAFDPDGIEAFILNQIGPSPKMKLNLKNDAADLTRLADITLAMAEIAGKFAPENSVGKKTPKAWNDYNDEMKKAATQLKDAVKANNNADVKKAFLALAASCNHCHTTFRED